VEAVVLAMGVAQVEQAVVETAMDLVAQHKPQQQEPQTLEVGAEVMATQAVAQEWQEALA
jgi:hypothetical protein